MEAQQCKQLLHAGGAMTRTGNAAALHRMKQQRGKPLIHDSQQRRHHLLADIAACKRHGRGLKPGKTDWGSAWYQTLNRCRSLGLARVQRRMIPHVSRRRLKSRQRPRYVERVATWRLPVRSCTFNWASKH